MEGIIGINYVVCPICNKKFKRINITHLKTHNLDMIKFKELYPECIKLVCDEDRQQISTSCIKSGCGKWHRIGPMSQDQKNKISKSTSGENNHFFGKKHTAETKQLMHQNHADFSGDKNPYKIALIKDENKRIEASLRSIQTWINIKKDPERYERFIKKLSNSISAAYVAGKMDFKSGKGHKQGYYYSIKFLKLFYYRSSYELRFLEWCEESSDVFDLKSCPFRIPYISDEQKPKNYLPDFLLNNKLLVEIKPLALLEESSLKHLSAFEYCEENNYNFMFITEIELNCLEFLKIL